MRLGWRRFVLVTLGGFTVILALLALFILLMNPYGNLPRILSSEHVITDINQRFQYPALVRSDRYDSAVIGASDARLLHPDSLEKVFGGNFVNLAMNAGLAHEQYRLADLFMREVEAPRTLLIALDHVWCDEKADKEIVTFRGFPEWMYDADWRNDLPYMLNAKSVEISGPRLRQALGFAEARFLDGYEVFTPPENAYDKVKVKAKLWGSKGPEFRKPQVPPYAVTSERLASWQFPALPWLDDPDAIFRTRGARLYAGQYLRAARPGSAMAARREECKARIAEIARRQNAAFNIPSGITSNDDNYWDTLHYRLPIAERIVKDIGQAIATGKDDPNGDFRYLAGPVAITSSPTPE